MYRVIVACRDGALINPRLDSLRRLILLRRDHDALMLQMLHRPIRGIPLVGARCGSRMLRKDDAGTGTSERAYTYTAGQGTANAAPETMQRDSVVRQQTRSRRFMRRAVQRIALLVALLILFYATSLHGISARTFVLAGVLVLSLYWIFKGWL